jgi:signal peptidase I
VVVVSSLIPGLGQLLTGRITIGIVWFISFYAAVCTAFWLAGSRQFPGFSAAFCVGGLAAVIWICMLIHAYQTAAGSEVRNADKPWIAVFLSGFVPGSGQFYNRDFVLGVVLLGMWIGTMLLPGLLQIAALLVYLWSALQAFRKRCAKEQVPPAGIRMFALVWVVHLIVIGFVFVGIRTFLVQAFKIPTGAMQPTLYGIYPPPWSPPQAYDREPPSVYERIAGIICQGKMYETDGYRTRGDRILVDKLAYRFRLPRRGEIVVFRTEDILDLHESSGRATYYVKRIVGLPSERVSIKPPYLYINGQQVTDPPIFEKIAQRKEGYFGYVIPVLSPPPRYLASETDSVQLGEDEYFVLGDNSRSSLDSRFWGPVPRRSIVGRVTKIYWPFDRRGIVQ